MPKFPTFPTLYDDLKTISISFLSKRGYLKPNQWRSGTITWSREENKTGSISIATNTNLGSPFLELNYRSNETPISYRVQLVSTPSNLGKGVIWFFICPHTGKRCRKLHLAGNYFYHRSAFRNCMYEKQTQSHKSRNLQKIFAKVFDSDKIYEQIYSKHFKKQYNGKPTKRYLKLIQKLAAARRISKAELIDGIRSK